MKYTETHEWIKPLADNTYMIGITHHAQEQLSDIVYVDLPEVGKVLKAGESLLAIDSVKAASDVYVPINGEIIAVNEALRDTPALINTSAEADGWLVKLSSQDVNLDKFLSKADYDTQTSTEAS